MAIVVEVAKLREGEVLVAYDKPAFLHLVELPAESSGAGQRKK